MGYLSVEIVFLYVLLWIGEVLPNICSVTSMQDFYPLFAFNPLPLLVYSPVERCIRLANEAMQATYGYTQEELQAMDLRDLAVDERNTTHKRKDGAILYVEVEIKDLVLEGEAMQLVLIRDITAYKRQEEELRLAKERTEEASRAKELFLASISHEIRTPMNAIMGMSYLLAKTALSPQQKTYNDTIRASAENLLVIINDILDMSKISAGKMTLERVGFRLPDLIQNLCNTIRYRAEEKGIGLFTEIDRRIAPVLLGDPLRLYQVLLNLVSNAIKFTDKGQVEIECRLMEQYSTANTVQFKVIDSGKGIDKEKLEKIFEAFTQEDESVTREYGGTGLGLSISKDLVRLFGGKLEVQSTKSTGTTFYFSMVLGVGEEEDIPQKDPEIGKAQIQKNLENLKVLLVEDHDINAFVATSIMAQWNIKPDLATNGKEAIKMLKQTRYDVVLMDIQMPVMGGLEATKIIRKDLRSDVPIIALTANAIKGDTEKYLAAGMNANITKPFEPNILLRTILDVTHRDSDMGKLYDLPKLRQMFDNNEAIVKKMLQLFINTTPALVQQMQDSYLHKAYHEVSLLAHKIKASVKTLGALELGDLYQQIEHLTTRIEPDEALLAPLYHEIVKQTQALIQEIQADIA